MKKKKVKNFSFTSGMGTSFILFCRFFPEKTGKKAGNGVKKRVEGITATEWQKNGFFIPVFDRYNKKMCKKTKRGIDKGSVKCYNNSAWNHNSGFA